MSDADRLEQEFRSGRLLRPSPDVLNLVDLANATAAAVGAGSLPLTSGAEKIAGMIGPADHLVLVAADGLGMALVESLDADGFMRRHVAASLRTIFPSTTATAFTSLATGQWPNRHAALGWFTYIPDIDTVSTIIPFIRSADGVPLTDLGLTIDRALPVPSQASAVDRPLLSLLPTAIAESTFSGYVSGGRPRTGYDAPEEAVASIVSAVLTASGPTYTYLYVPDVDYAGHALGFSDARTSGHRRCAGAVAGGLGPQARRPRPDRRDCRSRGPRRGRGEGSPAPGFRPPRPPAAPRAQRRQPRCLLPRPRRGRERV